MAMAMKCAGRGARARRTWRPSTGCPSEQVFHSESAFLPSTLAPPALLPAPPPAPPAPSPASRSARGSSLTSSSCASRAPQSARAPPPIPVPSRLRVERAGKAGAGPGASDLYVLLGGDGGQSDHRRGQLVDRVRARRPAHSNARRVQRVRGAIVEPERAAARAEQPRALLRDEGGEPRLVGRARSEQRELGDAEARRRRLLERRHERCVPQHRPGLRREPRQRPLVVRREVPVPLPRRAARDVQKADGRKRLHRPKTAPTSPGRTTNAGDVFCCCCCFCTNAPAAGRGGVGRSTPC